MGLLLQQLMTMLMLSMVLMDITVLVILVLDTLAMVMLLLLFPMLLQLFLMVILLLLLPLLPMVMLPLSMLPVVIMLLTPSELSMLPREKLEQSLKLMPFMHLMDTVVLDTTGLDMDLDTEDLGTLVLDSSDHMALDMDILTTAKLFNRSSTANL